MSAINTATAAANNNIIESSSKKKVSFDPTLDYSEPTAAEYFESSDVWYTMTELKAIAAKCRVIVQKLMAHPSLQPKLIESRMCQSMNESLRGLEVYTASNQEVIQKRLRASRRAVLDEQLMQQSLGIEYPEAIAMAYAAECQQASEVAQQVGAEDSRQVFDEADGDNKSARSAKKQRIAGSMTKKYDYLSQQQKQIITTPREMQRKIVNPAA